MKNHRGSILLVCVLSSSVFFGGCIKKAGLVKSAIVAGAGIVTAVLGDQISASKRVGIPNRRRKRNKRNKNIFIKSPESINISTSSDDSSSERSQS